ncbi:hypothetical protein GGS21DRAFT_491066 [Xylaria nigripes]|nr:hypothetical protein GGS21DRAFT_491066 [Xylaria nigripes]
MAYIVSVAYPQGCKFNQDYYLSSHMPFVQKAWGPLGLKSYNVVSYSNPDSPYVVQTFLYWESKELAHEAIAKPESKPVLDDIPNFSDQQPAFLMGETISQVSW